MRIERWATLCAGLALFVGCSNGGGDADAGDADMDADAGDADASRPLGMVGDPCTADEDCVVTSDHGRVVCLMAGWGFREGYCAIADTTNEGQCQAADPLSTHVQFPCSNSMCVTRCETSEDCREGYECFLGYQACWPRCEPGRACPFPPPELCEIDATCDDHDACTTDGCIGGICAHDRIDYQPRRVARIATSGAALDVDFSGRIENDNLQVIVAEGDQGAEVFDLSNPTVPRVYYRIDTLGTVQSVYRHGSRIFAAEGEDGFEVFDANGGAQLAHVLLDDGEARVQSFSYVGTNLIFIYAYAHGAYWYNVENEHVRGTCDTRGRAVGGVRAGDVSYVADSLAGLAVCSWEEGTTQFATEILQLDSPGRMLAASMEGEVVVTAEAGAGFGIFDASTQARPFRRYISDMLDGDVTDVQLLGKGTLAVAASEGGLYMFSLEDCFEPVPWFRWESDGPALAIDYTDGVIAIALGEAGIELLDIGCRAPPEDEVEE